MIFFEYIYLLSLSFLVIYGAHRSLMLFRSRKYQTPIIKTLTKYQDLVCIQIPIYNENEVALRIIDAVLKIEYPENLLEIQILDDSTDKTKELIDQKISTLKNKNKNIKVIRRKERTGFKAGALSNGLEQTNAKFIAIFDADFMPNSDFLLETIIHFENEKTAFVQARWGHINKNDNLLTKGQALLIDGHFIIEHSSRYINSFFNFNGTAGVWRKSAIEKAGGWSGDTITEDLDLSYRALLAGYKAVYLRDYVVPAELPFTISAFKSQQYRWMKGSAQVFKKLILKILKSDLSLKEKLEAYFHLSAHLCYLPMLIVVLFIIPMSYIKTINLNFSLEFLIFLTTFCSMFLFYGFSQKLQNKKIKILEVFIAIILGVGMSAHCARAVLSGYFKKRGDFIRTPKKGDKKLKVSKNLFNQFKGNIKEALIASYLFIGVSFLIYSKLFFSLPFSLIFLFGFLLVVFTKKRVGER